MCVPFASRKLVITISDHQFTTWMEHSMTMIILCWVYTYRPYLNHKHTIRTSTNLTPVYEIHATNSFFITFVCLHMYIDHAHSLVMWVASLIHFRKSDGRFAKTHTGTSLMLLEIRFRTINSQYLLTWLSSCFFHLWNHWFSNGGVHHCAFVIIVERVDYRCLCLAISGVNLPKNLGGGETRTGLSPSNESKFLKLLPPPPPLHAKLINIGNGTNYVLCN